MHKQDDRMLLRSFQEVGVQLTRDLDIQQVLLRIVEHSMLLTGARYGAAVTLTPRGEVKDFLHRGLTPEEVAMLPHYPEGKGLLGLVLRDRACFRIEDIASHPESVGFPNRHVPMQSFLGAPLIDKERMVGALYLTKPPGVLAFTEEDEELVTALAGFAAVGVVNAELFDLEAQRAARNELLQQVSSNVRRSLDVGQVLSATVEQLGRAARVERCFIRLASDEPGHGLGPIVFEWRDPGAESLSEDPQRHPVGSLAAVTRMTQWSNDIANDPKLEGPGIEGSAQDLLDMGVRSALSSPLEWGDHLLGVVSFHSTSPRAWSDEDIELIEGAAREVSVAIHHAQLYSQAVETAEELAKLDELRRDFVSMVSHELRSPMTVVAGIADVLRKRSAELSDPDREELIETLSRESRRLSRLVSDVLDLEVIDQGGLEVELREFDIAELAQESIRDAGQAERTRLQVEEGETTIRADRDRVKQVLLNLISNAAKYSPPTQTISVDVLPEEDTVLVSVTDRGPGMDEQQLARLFKRFSRVDTKSGQPGSGLGLYLSKTMIEKHGGQIWVESTPGVGSTFSFRIPRRA